MESLQIILLADRDELLYGMLLVFKLFEFIEHVEDFSSDTSSWLDLLVLLEVHASLIESIHRVSSLDNTGDVFVFIILGVSSTNLLVVLITCLEARQQIRHLV